MPRLHNDDGPRYLQIVAALENDIATGKLAVGQRLPTHREMATRLGLSIGTVSRAYAIAESRGLISGEVGRGTFVTGKTPQLGVTEIGLAHRGINLALNAPPATGETQDFARTMAEVIDGDDLHALMGYLPHQGLEAHRVAMAGWVSTLGMEAAPDRLHVTHGAQHAIAIALRLLARSAAPVLTENLPYSGIMSLALMEGYDLRGVLMDRHGLIPERLDAAFRESGPAVLYTTPTLQAATGSLMPPERRAEIAEIVARHDGWIVEDDAYGFLPPDGVKPLSAFLPERSIYVVSFAKCLSPSLRVGAMVAPEGMRDRIVNAIRSTGWMANPIMAEVTTRMIENGLMARQVKAKRAAAAERTEVARARLGPALDLMSDVPAFHVWMRLPPGRAPVGLMAQAAQAGITVAAPTPLQPLDTMGNGVRICLGGAPDIAALDGALKTLGDILQGTEAMSLV